jgi:hypothetical protein
MFRKRRLLSGKLTCYKVVSFTTLWPKTSYCFFYKNTLFQKVCYYAKHHAVSEADSFTFSSQIVLLSLLRKRAISEYFCVLSFYQTSTITNLKHSIGFSLLYILSSDLCGRLRSKCNGTSAETRFRLSVKRTSPFKSAGVGGASVQSTTGRRAVHISLQGLYCSCKSVFCSHVTLTGYPLRSLVSPSLLLPCVSVCHHISTGL